MSERLDGWLSSTSRRSEIVGFTDVVPLVVLVSSIVLDKG